MSIGQKGRKFSEEHKQKISNSNKGRVFSEETKNKIGNSNKGKIRSEETKNNIRNAAHRKLTSEDVIQIRYKYRIAKIKQKDLAEEYFVSVSTIKDVVGFKRAYKLM